MKIMIAAALAAFTLQEPTLLSGPPTDQQFAWARRSLNETMLDYPSARFRDVHADRRRVCGFVNGKNQLGAYTGWKRFVVMGVANSSANIEGSEDFDGLIEMMCDDEPAVPSDRDYSDRLTYRPGR